MSYPIPQMVDPSGATSGTDASDITNSGQAYFFVNAGNRWCFNGHGNAGKVAAFKSTDGGNTWVEKDSGNGPGSPDFLRPSMLYDGNHTVFIVRGNATHQLQFYAFDLSSELFTGAIGGPMPTPRNMSGFMGVVQFADGSFRCLYSNSTDHKLYFQDFDGVSVWSNETAFVTGTTNALLKQLLFSSDVCHIVYQVDASGHSTTHHYIQLAKNGTTSSDHNFAQDIEDTMGSTFSDGLIELDRDQIVFPLCVFGTGTPVNVVRGGPISAPTWTTEIVNDGTGSFNQNSWPTMIRLSNGDEQIFWVTHSQTGFTLTAFSAVATAINSGSGWGATSVYYDIGLNPFSDPDPVNCATDQILYIKALNVSGTVYFHFDGFSGNLNFNEPNFTFGISNVLTCSLTANATSIVLGESVILSWTTTGSPISASMFDGSTTTNVPPVSGSLVVTPTMNSTTYTLTVTNNTGSSTCQVTISAGTCPFSQAHHQSYPFFA